MNTTTLFYRVGLRCDAQQPRNDEALVVLVVVVALHRANHDWATKTHAEHRWQQRWQQQQHTETPPPATSTMVLPSGTPSDRDFDMTTTSTAPCITQCTTQHHAKQQHQQSTTTVDPQIVAIGTVHLASTMVPPTMPLHSNIIPTVMFER